MRNKISLLLLFFVVGYSHAQETKNETAISEVNSTVVNNQLSPEIIKLEFVTGFANGNLKTEEGKVVNRFQQSIFNFSAYPVTLINQKRKQLFMGVGYMNQQFSSFSDEANDAAFSEGIKSCYLGTAFTAKLRSKLFWSSYLQTGLNGTKPFDDIDKTFNVVLVSKLNHKAKRNLNVGLGVAYFSNMGNPLILPAVTAVYSKSRFVLNLDFPIKTEVEGVLAHGKFRPVVGLSYHGGTYYLKNSDQYLYNFGALGYAGVRVKIIDLLYLYAAYQIGVYDQYKAGAIHNLSSVGIYSGQSQWVVSLNVQVAKFVPLLQQ